MGRSTRTELGGEWHHVFNRGARHLPVFGDDHDRQQFLTILADGLGAARIHAYALMGNHYHLLLEASVSDLSATMKSLGERYTRRFNAKYGFDGALFRSRFRSKPVSGLAYLRHVIRYIHRNPVADGIGDWSYPWTSHRAFIGEVPVPAWLTTDSIAEFGGVEAFRAFVEEETPDNRPAVSPGRVRLDTPATIEFALGIASADELAVVARGGRGLRNDLRTAAALLGLEATDWTSGALAERYGYASGSALRMAASRARQRLEADDDFRGLVERARRRLRHLSTTSAAA